MKSFHASIPPRKTVKRSLLFLSVFFSSFVALFGQTLTGKVIDDVTQEALPYASIVVPGKNIGGIAYVNGEFSIDVSKASKDDSVRFTYIGYEPFSVSLASLDLSSHHTIKLKSKTTVLNPVAIAAKAETKTLGNDKASSRMTGWGDFKSLRGRTRGLMIEGAECPVRVKSFFFKIDENDWDSVAFRLNFLNVTDLKPGESLLQKNIFVATSRKHKWVKVDLTDHNIVICKRVIVTLEWVDAWGKTGEFSNVLTLSLSKSPGYSFSKEPGEEFGSFEPADYTPAMYVEVYGH